MDESTTGHGNQPLRDAMARAHLTRDQLADAIQVDKKTVDRWMSGAVMPQPRPAELAAKALGVAVHDLWPDKFPIMHPPSPGTLAISMYAGRAHVPVPVWTEHFESAQTSIDILVYGGTFLFDSLPKFGHHMLTAAERGVEIRIAVGDPASAAVARRGHEEAITDSLAFRCTMTLRRLAEIAPHDNITIRTHTAALYASLFRVDDTTIANHHIYGSPASDNPTWILHRTDSPELWTTYARSFDRIWNDPSTRTPLPH